MRALILALLLVGFTTHATLDSTQPSDVPKLGEMDSMRLEMKVLQLENMQLRMQQTPEGRSAYQLNEELKVMAQALEKPGFQIQRTAPGEWAYVPESPPEKQW